MRNFVLYLNGAEYLFYQSQFSNKNYIFTYRQFLANFTIIMRISKLFTLKNLHVYK